METIEKKKVNVILVSGSEWTEDGDISSSRGFITTCDLEDNDFKKSFKSFVNGFVESLTGEDNFIKEDNLEVEGINKLLKGIDSEFPSGYYYDFECKTLNISENNIKKMEIFPEDINITSMKDLTNLGIQSIDTDLVSTLSRILK